MEAVSSLVRRATATARARYDLADIFYSATASGVSSS